MRPEDDAALERRADPVEDTLSRIAAFWNRDAATYDLAPAHRMSNMEETAAWTAALTSALGPVPLRVLDVGSGTGFLSLPLARLGHSVTAQDISAGMLDRLADKASVEGLSIECRVSPAHEVSGRFDAVVSRHLLWTLPHPAVALSAWRAVAPTGRLALFESTWGIADRWWRARSLAKAAFRGLDSVSREHHADYAADLLAKLPLGHGHQPGALLELLPPAGWRPTGLTLLRDVHWVRARQASLPVRLTANPRPYVVTAA